MQTRKRAKSVSFGKVGKEKKEKEEVKETPKKEIETVEVKKTSEKAEIVERRVVPDKPLAEELSSTLPDIKTEPDTAKVATPASEFVSDSTPEPISEISKDVTEPPVTPDESSSSASEVAQPLESPAPSTVSPEQTTQPIESQELSSTLPPSAFTIQTIENGAPPPADGAKKRFGLYFFVVAFLSFILGLGAMAAASYFGVINLPLPKLPFASNMHISTLLGAKPTPTAMPKPTTAPTAKPVNLQQYSISVLNGSGIVGQAGKMKASLTADKFNVSSTGNAANSNFTRTEIAAKKSVNPAYLAKLEDELKKTLDVDTTVANFPDSSTTDVTVTLGSQTAQ